MINLDVEVIDNELVRIAGTGPYANDLGRQLTTGTNAFRWIISNRKEKIIKNSGKDTECLSCTRRVSCQEKAFLGIPVLFKNECLGVISLVCFNEEQREQLLANIPLYMGYIEDISKVFIATKLEDMYYNSLKNTENVIRLLSSKITEGVLEVDDKGCCTHINEAARKQLKLNSNDKLSLISVRPFGKRRTANRESEEFIIKNGSQEIISPGVLIQNGHGKLLVLTHNKTDTSGRRSANGNHNRMVGDSRPMQRLHEKVRKIASSPSSVLINGESGSGKEVVARLIHESGARRKKPFIAINCAAIPEHLLESELFGYARGAFTGAATQGKEGLIKSADGGTLFLDEIGDMPLNLQAKLLRVLDRREISPVGSSTVSTVNIRVISATHQNLQTLTEKKLFREDLYYRLNVIPLIVPSLRERKSDIPLLASFFLKKQAKEMGLPVPVINDSTMAYLNRWNWPGNVRELANTMEYLINMVEHGGVILPELLPEHFHLVKSHQSDSHRGESHPLEGHQVENPTAENHSAAVRPVSTFSVEKSPASMSLEEMEKQRIQAALKKFDAKKGKQQVADELGIGIATLYRKIKKYHLEDDA
ncbi:sigma-54 interaction domain-containing protein [Endozoicomonas montiporae]|nr:sigma-54-dependent Fis family transcriptional regulator [Endozoicomonas montiporae]AMO57684.1 putative sigma-54-dependent transcriptional regulator YgeV [Endozoicomonas montiporae CL-33]